MTNEELLKEAKRRYPINSKLSNRNLHLGCDFNINGHWFCMLGKELLVNNRREGGGRYTVYKDGMWADIISLPEGYKNTKLTAIW